MTVCNLWYAAVRKMNKLMKNKLMKNKLGRHVKKIWQLMYSRYC